MTRSMKTIEVVTAQVSRQCVIFGIYPRIWEGIEHLPPGVKSNSGDKDGVASGSRM